MPGYVVYVLLPAIGYFSYVCGRAYGTAGVCVFVGALLILAVAVWINADAQSAGLGTIFVLGCICVAAAIIGAIGAAMRRAALQSAGVKAPKGG